jgi:hypothetical protein
VLTAARLGEWTLPVVRPSAFVRLAGLRVSHQDQEHGV